MNPVRAPSNSTICGESQRLSFGPLKSIEGQHDPKSEGGRVGGQRIPQPTDVVGGPVLGPDLFGPRTRRWSSPVKSTRTASTWSLANTPTCVSQPHAGTGQPHVAGFDAQGPVDIVDRRKKVVATTLAADLAKPDEVVNRRRQPKQGQPAKSLTAGDIAILEIDGQQLSVEITDVEDDPTYLGEDEELRELQITYRITEGHDRSGELGVTTLVEDERS